MRVVRTEARFPTTPYSHSHVLLAFKGGRRADEHDVPAEGEILFSIRPANKRTDEEGGLVRVILDGKPARRYRRLRRRVNYFRRRLKRQLPGADDALTAARQRLREFKHRWVSRVYSS